MPVFSRISSSLSSFCDRWLSSRSSKFTNSSRFSDKRGQESARLELTGGHGPPYSLECESSPWQSRRARMRSPGEVFMPLFACLGQRVKNVELFLHTFLGSVDFHVTTHSN